MSAGRSVVTNRRLGIRRLGRTTFERMPRR